MHDRAKKRSTDLLPRKLGFIRQPRPFRVDCKRNSKKHQILIRLILSLSYYVNFNAFPIIVTKEGKWFVASCPLLDIATQGKSEDEVKENMVDLINDYLNDPDTSKPIFEDLISLSISNIAVKVPKGVLYSKASTAVSTKSKK